MNREAELADALDGLVTIVERVGCGDWRDEHGQRLKDTKQWVAAYLAATKKAQTAVPAEVARAVQILRQHNQWRRGADNNHWQATPYSPAELGRAIDTVCDHVSHAGQPDVLRRATEYAHDIVTWLHRDHYADNTTFEPFGDLLGLLSQIDNMICGWKEPAQPAVPDGLVVIHRRLFDVALAAFRLIDDSEEDAQTGFISVDCEIGQRALKNMHSVFVDMEIEHIEDLYALLAASKEDGT